MASESHSLLAYRWQRTRARLGTALRREGRTLRQGLGDPMLVGLILISLLLVFLAYQVFPPFALNAGQRPEEVYIEGFHAVERSAAQTYRWSTGEGRLQIPGLGQASQRLDVVLAAPRPPDQPPPRMRLEAASQLLLETAIAPAPQTYSILLPAEALPGGNLDLLLYSDTFSTTRDPRLLGVVWQGLEIRPVSRPIGAAPLAFLWVGLTVVLVVLLGLRLGWPRWVSLTAGTVMALLLAAALAWARPLLTPGLSFLPLGLAVAWVIVALAQGLVAEIFRRGGAALSLPAERALWSIVVIFLTLRLAGVLHPALQTWDLCFHLHRTHDVAQGKVLFTIISAEWRSQETFYLPALHILQAPLWGIFGGGVVPFKVVGVFLDSCSGLLVAYIGRRLLGWEKIAPLAAFFYMSMPQSTIIFSWGIVSNILGQWLLLLVVALTVSPSGRLTHRREWAAATSLLVPTLLAHPGTVLLSAGLIGGLLATVWLAPLLRSLSRAALWRWAGAALVAVVLAILLYYSYFAGTMWNSIQAMRQGSNAEQPTQGGILVRGPVIDPDLGLVPVEVSSRREAVLAGIDELVTESRAYYYTWPMLLALIAPVGYAFKKRFLAVRLSGVAFAVALVFAVVGLTTNLYVRYMYFLLPIVAVGTAWWLAYLARNRWAGKLVATLVGLYLGLSGMWFWIEQVLYYSAGGPCR